MFAFFATPYLAEAMVPCAQWKEGQFNASLRPDREPVGLSKTYSDVRTVTVQILIGVFGNSLSPFGSTFELNVINVDTTVIFRYELAEVSPPARLKHESGGRKEEGRGGLTCR